MVKYILFLALLLPFSVSKESYKNNTLNGLYIEAAKKNNINPNILRAICEVESNHNTRIKKVWDGGSYSYGICQIKMATAKAMGFKGTEKELISPKFNIEYAAKYLAYQLKRYKGDYKKAIVSYNRGSYTKEEMKSYAGKVGLAYLIYTVEGK